MYQLQASDSFFSISLDTEFQIWLIILSHKNTKRASNSGKSQEYEKFK